ncbi:MAG: hypothetical protein ACTHKM_00035 [Tsuneonella sp.]
MTVRPLLVAGVTALALAATPALAQSARQGAMTQSQTLNYLQSVPKDQQPDVLLDIPNLSVEEITLEVDNLQAHVSLDARLANLLKLTAGADASIDKVKITIKGVKVQAALVVRLDNVKAIIDRTLQTLDKNPAIIQQLTGTVDNAVGTVGGVVNNTVSTVGDLTRGVLQSGRLLDLANSGLSVVSSTVDSAGNTVRKLRGTDGVLYQVVTDTAGKILRSSRL